MAKGTRHSRDELRADTRNRPNHAEGRGLEFRAAALTFKRVFARVDEDTGVRLTNASVIHRVWVSQSDFQTDLLVPVAQGQCDAEIDAAEHRSYRSWHRSISRHWTPVSRRSEIFVVWPGNSIRRRCTSQSTGP